MSSPLMFVRDGRQLPYVPVTIAALDAIRAMCDEAREDTGARRSYPHALAAYMALLEFANDHRADRAAVTQKELGERARSSRTAVQTALGDLAAAGVLLVYERRHGASRVENEYVLVEPGERSAIDDTLARVASDPRSCGEQLSKEGKKEATPGERAREQAPRPDPRERIPDDFPDHLRPHAREVMRVLRAVAEQHGARKVWPLAVAKVIASHPRHPLVATAHALAVWAVDPPRPIRDVVSTYRTFLEQPSCRELEATERLGADGMPAAANGRPPAGVTPIRRSGQSSDWSTLKRLAKIDGASEAEAVAYANSGGSVPYARPSAQPEGGSQPHV